jgi:hypothetical protein
VCGLAAPGSMANIISYTRAHCIDRRAGTHRASRLSSELLAASSSSGDAGAVEMTSSGWCLIMMEVRNLRACVCVGMWFCVSHGTEPDGKTKGAPMRALSKDPHPQPTCCCRAASTACGLRLRRGDMGGRLSGPSTAASSPATEAMSSLLWIRCSTSSNPLLDWSARTAAALCEMY